MKAPAFALHPKGGTNLQKANCLRMKECLYVGIPIQLGFPWISWGSTCIHAMSMILAKPLPFQGPEDEPLILQMRSQ